MEYPCTDKLKGICLVCFLPTGRAMLKAHHHCCERGIGCEDRYNEIVAWERLNFRSSFLEGLSKCY